MLKCRNDVSVSTTFQLVSLSSCTQLKAPDVRSMPIREDALELATKLEGEAAGGDSGGAGTLARVESVGASTFTSVDLELKFEIKEVLEYSFHLFDAMPSRVNIVKRHMLTQDTLLLFVVI